MITYEVTTTLHLTVNFSEKEFEEMVNKYKNECLSLGVEANNKQIFNYFLEDNYSWDWFQYEVYDSKSNVNEIYEKAKENL